jgi:hypothetical protein
MDFRSAQAVWIERFTWPLIFAICSIREDVAVWTQCLLRGIIAEGLRVVNSMFVNLVRAVGAKRGKG